MELLISYHRGKINDKWNQEWGIIYEKWNYERIDPMYINPNMYPLKPISFLFQYLKHI
jgi:hypothetical protein